MILRVVCLIVVILGPIWLLLLRNRSRDSKVLMILGIWLAYVIYEVEMAELINPIRADVFFIWPIMLISTGLAGYLIFRKGRQEDQV